MWVQVHRAPHWSTRSRKRKRADVADFPGVLLPKPKTKPLEKENLSLNDMRIGHCAIQGYRVSMEDAHIIDCLDECGMADHTVLSILDGHAGANSALMIKGKHLEKGGNRGKYVNTAEQLEMLSAALVQAYVAADKELLDEQQTTEQSGTTCVTAIVTDSHIVVANVGDSRAVLGTAGRCVSLSEDHKPTTPDERARIENAGCFVLDDRVNGELAMSRALGDFTYKDAQLNVTDQAVSCIPDISIQERTREDEFLVLACDGVWDAISNPESVSFLQDIVMKTDPNITMSDAANALISLALTQGSTDNISAIVANLNPAS
eukprot:GSChrysophyteH1.ASY1.ANO1.3190.1 assembled CDS